MSSPKKAVAFKYSPEQEAIFCAGDGQFLVSANAGSGKTESSAEKGLRLIQAELAKRFADAQGKFTAEMVEKVLGQMLVVTFTKKAASELDERIKKKMSGANIPIPERFGKQVIICRTLDSFLQRWVKGEYVFGIWMEIDPSWATALDVLISKLSPEARSGLGENPRWKYFVNSAHLITEVTQAAITDYIVCLELRLPLPFAFDLAAFEADYYRHLAGVTLTGSPGWKCRPIEEINERHAAWTAQLEALKRKHTLAPLSLTEEEMKTLEIWERIVEARREFMSAHEMARGRSYHPEFRKPELANFSVLRVIASGKYTHSLNRLHSMAAAYLRIKRHFGLVDFGDFLSIFTRIIERNPSILDRKNEYPRHGIRRKIVIWDEVQDNSPLQFQVLLSFQPYPGVPYFSMSVGDPFQSLYQWRGANPWQFTQDIENMRKAHPKNLLALTCSFRSAKKIVEMGNDVIARLSKSEVRPKRSRTVYEEDGHVAVAPPFNEKMDEAKWVMARIEQITVETGGSFMVVARSGVRTHPIYKMVKESGRTDISLMTVHGAKGLEADHVFVIDCAAGRFPDPRVSADQEANAFYVAVTRPRRSLFISSSIKTIRKDTDGNPIVDLTGPSPYFSMVKEIKEMALLAGWDEITLRYGLNTHKQAIGTYMGAINKNLERLKSEAESGDFKGIVPEQMSSHYYLGAISPYEHIEVKAKLPQIGGAADGPERPITDAEANRLFSKLNKLFFKNRGQPPENLPMGEKRAAAALGWIDYKGITPAFTPAFRTQMSARQVKFQTSV